MATFKEEMDAMAFQYSDDHLEHHGTKGMKWGIRNYQNEDGSLTDEGRKHYRIGGPRTKKEGKSFTSFLKKKPKKEEHKKEEPKKEEPVETREVKSKYKNYRELKADAKYLDNNQLQQEMTRLQKMSELDKLAKAEKPSAWKKAEKLINTAIGVSKTLNSAYIEMNKVGSKKLLRQMGVPEEFFVQPQANKKETKK